jgi:acetyl-CoA carboxylase carboxyl transferase subunit alpha
LDFEKDIQELKTQIERLEKLAEERGLEVADEMRMLQNKLEVLKRETYQNLSAAERVELARHPKRPYMLDYIGLVFTDFVELHGDRCFGDDGAIVGGWARMGGRSLMVIGHQRGRDMKDNLRRHFGMAHPEGYRKALRLMRMAEKFGRPIVTMIDTMGAYPGIGAEERGQAEAIAMCIREMSRLKVPVIAVVIGEGGSGGALALGVADRVLMLENAIYSVISPEGCAAILWKTNAAKDKAAEALKLTALDLESLGVVDGVIPEPIGGAHTDWDETASALQSNLLGCLDELTRLDTDALRQKRREKFERMGEWTVSG